MISFVVICKLFVFRGTIAQGPAFKEKVTPVAAKEQTVEVSRQALLAPRGSVPRRLGSRRTATAFERRHFFDMNNNKIREDALSLPGIYTLTRF
jgi:hypothetical protein